MPRINICIGLLISALMGAFGVTAPVFASSANVNVVARVPEVPFYSQFADISLPEWRGKACGVASLAMLVDFYHQGSVLPQTLLKQGIAAGAYVRKAGWSHRGLALLAGQYGLDGVARDLSDLKMDAAFTQLAESLKDGPVIASVYYKFDPKSTIPHLVVINGIENGVIYYNDPAAKSGGKHISTAKFMAGWKKRFIVIRPEK